MVIQLIVRMLSALYVWKAASSSSSFFKLTGGKETRDVMKKEFFMCDRENSCTNVIKTVTGRLEKINDEKELTTRNDIVAIWKKIKIGQQAPACKNQALGMESRKIPDSSITASSGSGAYAPKHGRLNNNKYWNPWHTESNPYFQVDFGRSTMVYGVATQGDTQASFIKTYLLSYSKYSHGNFETVKDASTNTEKLFNGNTNGNGIVKIDLPIPVQTRFIRILPKSKSFFIVLRAEFYGCYI